MEVDLSCSQPSSCPVISAVNWWWLQLRMKFQRAVYRLSCWYWQIAFLLVRRWMQYELQTLPIRKFQLKIPTLIYFGIKALVLQIWKLKRKILWAIACMNISYFSFSIIWMTHGQLVICARTRISIWPDCALLIYVEYHLLTWLVMLISGGLLTGVKSTLLTEF